MVTVGYRARVGGEQTILETLLIVVALITIAGTSYQIWSKFRDYDNTGKHGTTFADEAAYSKKSTIQRFFVYLER